MKISTIKIDDIVPYARNPRKNKNAISKVMASLKEFGFRQPIVVDSDLVVIVGHTRLEAARQLGLKEVPVHIAEGLTKAQIKAYRIADNRTNQEAEWDLDLLKLELEDLADDDYDLALTAFDDKELQSLIANPTEGLTDEDAVPETPSEPVTKLGDIWILGNHRIICGDSTDATVVHRLLGDVKPHLMVTDPPYGVEYDANWRNEAARTSKGMGNRAIGAGAVGKVLNDDRADWTDAWALFPGNIAYIWHGSLQTDVVKHSIESNGFKTRALIIWAKNQFAIGRGDYHHQHEPCWYAVRGTGNWTGDRKQSTVWKIDKPQKSETGHSTQKPIECMRKPIENNSSVGQAIYEPFSGSGTTIIACEQTGRHCYAIELNPAYVDVAVKRWEDFTGKKAVLSEL
jgi:DNA modification methylase